MRRADLAAFRDIASSKSGRRPRQRTNGTDTPVTIGPRVEVEVDHGRWVTETGADGDAALSQDIAGLVEVSSPSVPRVVLSWAVVTVRPTESTRAPASPAHDVTTLLIDVTVAESLWHETGPSSITLAEDVRACISDQLAAISPHTKFYALLGRRRLHHRHTRTVDHQVAASASQVASASRPRRRSRDGS